jgi:hypothetical protein
MSAGIGIVQLLALYSVSTHSTIPHALLVLSSRVCRVANSPRFACYSEVPSGAYWSLLATSVSVWIPASSVLSACYCLDRRCVLKSLVTSAYDRRISN